MNTFKKIGPWLIIPVLVAGLVIIGLYISKHQDKTESAESTDSTPEVVQTQEPNIGRPEIVDTPGATPATPAPTQPTPEPTPTPTPSQPPVAATRPNVIPSAISYTNDTLGFTAKLPSDAKVYPQDNNEIVFAPASGGQYYTVSAFPLANETISSIEKQLKSSPSVTSTQRTNIHGYDAVLFKSPNIPGVGYAVLKGQRLYYITGHLTPQLLNDFNLI